MTVYDNLIAGSPSPSATATANINPSDTNDVVGMYAQADRAQVEAAVESAAAAFPSWAATSGQTRRDILDRAAAEITARRLELGDLLAREEGKTLPEAIGEVDRTARVLGYHAAQAVMPQGEVVESVRPGITIDVVREPLGVIGVVTPWNFPMAIPAWKIAPALAYGNTVVFKPAELVPGCAWELVDILQRAGLPEGVLNLTMGRGSELGDALTGHPLLSGVTFTGSVATGARVLASAQKHQARVQLEMGGKNPLIVCDDADLDVAVSVAADGSFGSTGQRCTAAERFIVDARVHDEFVERLTAKMATLRVGDARAAGTEIGPVVDEGQLNQNLTALETAASEGGEVVGGDRLDLDTPGFYMRPALVVGTKPSDSINQREVFGPVASVVRTDDYDQAVALANDTEYGLSAAIVTTSLAKARDFQRRAQAGMVMVNVPTAGVDYHVPFGGRGKSSYGTREQGLQAREFFTSVKTTYMAAGRP